MTEAKKTPSLFEKNKLEKFRVRQGLVLPLTREKTYTSGELVELTEAQYKANAHKVETEAQYQAAKKKGQRGE